MPTIRYWCGELDHPPIEQVFSILEVPPANVTCSYGEECVARRIWEAPMVLVSGKIDGQWTLKEYDHLAHETWPETVAERHERHRVNNAEEAKRRLDSQVQTKVHPGLAPRGPVYFPGGGQA